MAKKLLVFFCGLSIGILVSALFLLVVTKTTLQLVVTSHDHDKLSGYQNVASQPIPQAYPNVIPTTNALTLPLPVELPQTPTGCDIDAIDGSVAGLPVLQLTDLISRLLPSNGFQDLGWDFLSDKNFLLWKTSGVNSNSEGGVCRQALARVKVGDFQSRVLLQKWAELPWSISLYSDGNPNFGPNKITILPGGPTGTSACFGVGFDGCTFNPDQVFKSAPFKISAVCSPPTLGGITKVYLAIVPQEQPNLIIYNETGGSGGSSSWIDIRPISDEAQVCKPS